MKKLFTKLRLLGLLTVSFFIFKQGKARDQNLDITQRINKVRQTIAKNSASGDNNNALDILSTLGGAHKTQWVNWPNWNNWVNWNNWNNWGNWANWRNF